MPVDVVRDAGRASHLSGLRREILRALDRPDSASGVAGRLGTTRQKVNYHLRALEEAGFVELAEERQRRGLTERIMRRTSDAVVVDPRAFDVSGLTEADAIGLGGVVATATDVIRSAASVASAASAAGERVAASVLDGEVRLASPTALDAMVEEIAAVIARHSSPTGLRFRTTTILLPVDPEVPGGDAE